MERDPERYTELLQVSVTLQMSKSPTNKPFMYQVIRLRDDTYAHKHVFLHVCIKQDQE